MELSKETMIKTNLNLQHNQYIKIVACLCMLVDHIGAVFLPNMIWIRIVGRIAMPIFAYQIAEGFKYTHDVYKYVKRLLILAVVSELPFILLFNEKKLNILFAFVIALLFMDAYRKKNYIILLLSLILMFFCQNIEYAGYATLVVCFFISDNKKYGKYFDFIIVTALYTFFTGQILQLFSYLAIPIIRYKDKIKVNIDKRYFYYFYPLHLAFLYVVKLIIIH